MDSVFPFLVCLSGVAHAHIALRLDRYHKLSTGALSPRPVLSFYFFLILFALSYPEVDSTTTRLPPLSPSPFPSVHAKGDPLRVSPLLSLYMVKDT